MKAIIVDDERLARNELKSLLANHKEIEVIAECANATEAKEKIDQLKPDVVFLDINMPGKSGLELVEEISALPDVVFVTAYDEHAIKAFELNAFDYLLKPVKNEEILAAIAKAFESQEREQRRNALEDVAEQFAGALLQHGSVQSSSSKQYVQNLKN